MTNPRIKELQEDIRFTRYRLGFNLTAASALEVKLAGMERDLEEILAAERRKAA